MANPFPFTVGQVLTAAQMNGIGEYTAYTPTFTNLTLGNGTLTASFCQVSKLVNFRIKVVFGSTTSIGGTVDLTLPVAANNVALFDSLSLLAHYFDSSLNVFIFNQPMLMMNGTTSVRLFAFNVAGTFATAGDIGATTPFTWATSDRLTIAGTYQAA